MRVGQTIGLEIATGGDPVGALSQAALGITSGKPYVIDLAVAHDDGCPCVEGDRSMGSCTCEVVQLKARRVA